MHWGDPQVDMKQTNVLVSFDVCILLYFHYCNKRYIDILSLAQTV